MPVSLYPYTRSSWPENREQMAASQTRQTNTFIERKNISRKLVVQKTHELKFNIQHILDVTISLVNHIQFQNYEFCFVHFAHWDLYTNDCNQSGWTVFGEFTKEALLPSVHDLGAHALNEFWSSNSLNHSKLTPLVCKFTVPLIQPSWLCAWSNNAYHLSVPTLIMPMMHAYRACLWVPIHIGMRYFTLLGSDPTLIYSYVLVLRAMNT